MLLDTQMDVVGVTAEIYEVETPRTGYAEQSPNMWWEGTLKVLRRLQEQYPSAFAQVAAVGLSGQMHGLVVVDKDKNPLRPAILWLDQRSARQVEAVHGQFSSDTIGKLLHNRLFPGFAFSSLLWMKEYEPELFGRIFSIMLPKDYIRCLLTGNIGSDYSDASATGAFNTGQWRWSYELIDHFRINRGIFPECKNSAEIAGFITKAAAKQTGLCPGTPVVFGGGDQPVQSIGNGLVYEGALISNIGTGGQVACFSKTELYDEKLRTHTFCHALPGAYTIFGATLGGGLSLNWLAGKVLHQNDYRSLDRDSSEIPAGSGGLIYLPYIAGERTPHMDVHAKGMFFGITLDMDSRHFARAVMEGVVYSLKDSLLILQEMGIGGSRIIASGGGSKSALWLQMQADILGMDVLVSEVKEQACLGACILAAVGAGIYRDAAEGCAEHVSFRKEVYRPDPRVQSAYQRGYDLYRQLYRETNNLMHI
jgi:xylulokinase